ncbi:hypothetical protein N7475_004529 [Penicillium sp. IBT 31633x]|nr:hypothetical protein N7475_004529 [Penicillium sp. IBT 31633x]
MRFHNTLFYGLALLPVALAFWPPFRNTAEIASGPYANKEPNVKVETLFQFHNNGSWVHNLVLRPDGNILLTRLDTPEVWLVDATSGEATLAYSFPGVTSCFGISEIADDVFAVVIGNFSTKTYEPTPGSYSVQRLDFANTNRIGGEKNNRVSAQPAASEIAALPEALALNGMATFSRESNLVLIADSPKGVVWKLDTGTGDYGIALNDTTMQPAQGQPLPLGVNNVAFLSGYVYYTSTTRMEYCRVKVDKDANPIGDFEVIASGFLPDNLELTDDGTAYIPTDPQNSVVRLTPSGQISLVAGGQISTELAGPTSVRLSKDRQTLYVGTSGGQIAPVLGTFIEPGKVSKITFED